MLGDEDAFVESEPFIIIALTFSCKCKVKGRFEIPWDPARHKMQQVLFAVSVFSWGAVCCLGHRCFNRRTETVQGKDEQPC